MRSSRPRLSAIRAGTRYVHVSPDRRVASSDGGASQLARPSPDTGSSHVQRPVARGSRWILSATPRTPEASIARPLTTSPRPETDVPDRGRVILTAGGGLTVLRLR